MRSIQDIISLVREVYLLNAGIRNYYYKDSTTGAATFDSDYEGLTSLLSTAITTMEEKFYEVQDKK